MGFLFQKYLYKYFVWVTKEMVNVVVLEWIRYSGKPLDA